ncbi:16S rRNA (cytosine(1402)-N(4))-methyltransferase RsmH [Planctomycetota bacterium]
MTGPAIVHCPVLMKILRERLDFDRGATVIDATVGQGGHALWLCGKLGPDGRLVGLDVDADSLAGARERLGQADCRIELVRENFSRLDEILSRLDLGRADVILADLGVSSAQLAQAERGFSFQSDGPLDMRFDDRQARAGGELVNKLPEADLADLIWRYGQERHSRRIARAIVTARRKRTLERTGQLVEVINKALGIRGKGRKSKIHPATRTFQALRIAVNDELGNLERLLTIGSKVLNKGGQIAIISFHSLEDRLVKWNFKNNAKEGVYEVLTKKPLTADKGERSQNPRSRSAKLRLARRI